MNKPHKHAVLIKENLCRFMYDEASGELRWSGNYGPRARAGALVGSVDSHGYLQTKLTGRMVLLHRIVWMMFNDSYPEQIDHIDRDRLNNRIDNLRAATNMTNQHNAGIRKDNTSGCAGVTSKNGRWQVRIQVNGNRLHLGTFNSVDEAVAEYKRAKEIYHGQVA